VPVDAIKKVGVFGRFQDLVHPFSIDKKARDL